MKTCIAPGCIAARKSHHVMCSACWAQVPPAIQQRVYAAWNPASIRQSPEWTAALADAVDSLRREESSV